MIFHIFASWHFPVCSHNNKSAAVSVNENGGGSNGGNSVNSSDDIGNDGNDGNNICNGGEGGSSDINEK